MMRIHSDYLKLSDFHDATSFELVGVYATVSEHGSRSHARAFEVSLEGNGYRKNTGKYGAGEEFGATWDEWGVFLARLFDIDANAVAGAVKHPVYRDGYDFHAKTADRFVDLELPEDTHKRHNWKATGRIGHRACTKCTAEQIWSY